MSFQDDGNRNRLLKLREDNMNHLCDYNKSLDFQALIGGGRKPNKINDLAIFVGLNLFM